MRVLIDSTGKLMLRNTKLALVQPGTATSTPMMVPTTPVAPVTTDEPGSEAPAPDAGNAA